MNISKDWLFIVVILLAGCASVGSKITEDNNLIKMPYYSIVVPPDQGLLITSSDDNQQSVTITKKNAFPVFYMSFSKQYANIDIAEKTWAIKQLADDYRNHEKRNMILKGATRARSIKDATMGEDIINGKKFFTMELVVVDRSAKSVRSFLYIYIPQEIDDVGRFDFFISNFSEEIPIDGSSPNSYKELFLDSLKSLTINH